MSFVSVYVVYTYGNMDNAKTWNKPILFYRDNAVGILHGLLCVRSTRLFACFNVYGIPYASFISNVKIFSFISSMDAWRTKAKYKLI